jgi:hypothetical protein
LIFFLTIHNKQQQEKKSSQAMRTNIESKEGEQKVMGRVAPQHHRHQANLPMP